MLSYKHSKSAGYLKLSVKIEVKIIDLWLLVNPPEVEGGCLDVFVPRMFFKLLDLDSTMMSQPVDRCTSQVLKCRPL